MGRISTLDLPGLADYTSFDAAQETFGFLGYKCTFLDQAELSTNTPKSFYQFILRTGRVLYPSPAVTHLPSPQLVEGHCHGDF